MREFICRFGTAKRLGQVWDLIEHCCKMGIFKSFGLLGLWDFVLTFGSAKPTEVQGV